jgi:hypothetical protein
VARTTLDNIEWLLILSFPNGGSTAVAKLLLTAPGTISLNPRVEGQWLVPEMSAPLARWDPRTPLDHDVIRSRWIAAARLAASTVGPLAVPPLVIEKSPPNMCRYKAILALLKGRKTYLAVLTRDPFATCASWHRRHGLEGVERDWGWAGARPTGEAMYFRALGEIWLQRAQYLDAARAGAVRWIRYEDFAARPSAIAQDLARDIPPLRGVDPDAIIAVKDYPPQKIHDMNAEQISGLNTRQLEAIASALEPHRALVERFGYAATPPPARSGSS